MQRSILLSFCLLLMAIFLGARPEASLAKSGPIILNTGEKLVAKSNQCGLSIPKNTPVKIQIKCTATLNSGVLQTRMPNTKVTLNAGEQVTLKPNHCALAVIQNDTLTIKVKCQPYVSPLCWAQNNSYKTTCPEQDNINVPIFGAQVTRFQVTATHPTYAVGADNCAPNFSGCSLALHPLVQTPSDSCTKLLDDGINVVEGCTVQNWWRPYTMQIQVAAQHGNYHYLVISRKIQGANEWPQFFVLYEDSYMRLIPQPPVGRSSVCFGSSVIIGPASAVFSQRPYADIQGIQVNPSTMALDVSYKVGGTSHVSLAVDRTHATAQIDVNYTTTNKIPFAIFRSMYIADGKADVDHVQTAKGDLPIQSNWQSLVGQWWFFHRTTRSNHNTSAPDIRIQVVQSN